MDFFLKKKFILRQAAGEVQFPTVCLNGKLSIKCKRLIDVPNEAPNKI